MFSNPIILVASDFSPSSDLAIKAAESLRRKSGGKMHVAHAIEHLSEINIVPDVNRAEMMGQLSKMLAEQVKRCEADCSHEIVLGRPYRVLHDGIREKGADILVMGHRGSGDDNFQMGSLTSKMVSSSEVPVLVINQDLNAKTVAGLVDPLSPAEKVISTTEEWAWLFGADPEIISIWLDISAQNARRSPALSSQHESYTEEERSKIIEHIRGLVGKSLKAESRAKVKVAITGQKNISEALVRTMEEEGVGIAVMRRHQKGMIENLLIGSVTRKVLERFQGNVLILPPK